MDDKKGQKDGQIDIYEDSSGLHLAMLTFYKGETSGKRGSDVKDFENYIVKKVDARYEYGVMVYTVRLSDKEIANTNQSDFVRGEKFMRDAIIATVIGLQNGIGDTEAAEYKALQNVYETIVDKYGDMFQPVKV